MTTPPEPGSDSPNRVDRTTNLLTNQTQRDREEKERRLCGRQSEIALRKAQLRRTFRTPKLKETLLAFAEQLAQRRGFPLVPRIERRELDLLVAWFIDHFPAMFLCSSVIQMLYAPFGPPQSSGSVEPDPPGEDFEGWRLEGDGFHDLFEPEVVGEDWPTSWD
jgi:hypothetical protein